MLTTPERSQYNPLSAPSVKGVATRSVVANTDAISTSIGIPQTVMVVLWTMDDGRWTMWVIVHRPSSIVISSLHPHRAPPPLRRLIQDPGPRRRSRIPPPAERPRPPPPEPVSGFATRKALSACKA